MSSTVFKLGDDPADVNFIERPTDFIRLTRYMLDNSSYCLVQNAMSGPHLYDVFSASVVIGVYDRLGLKGKKSVLRYLNTHGIMHVMSLCFKVLEKARK